MPAFSDSTSTPVAEATTSAQVIDAFGAPEVLHEHVSSDGSRRSVGPSGPVAPEERGRRPGRALLPRRYLLLGSLTAGLLAACGAGRAGPSAPSRAPRPTSGAATLGLGIIGLTVKDLPASLAFYRRLGLAIPGDVDTSAGAFRLPLPTGQVFFWETVQYVRGFDPSYRQGTGDRRVTLEFGFARSEDVDAMYETLLATGSHSRFPPTTWNDGDIRYAIVTDPDDNQISLRWPLVS